MIPPIYFQLLSPFGADIKVNYSYYSDVIYPLRSSAFSNVQRFHNFIKRYINEIEFEEFLIQNKDKISRLFFNYLVEVPIERLEFIFKNCDWKLLLTSFKISPEIENLITTSSIAVNDFFKVFQKITDDASFLRTLTEILPRIDSDVFKFLTNVDIKNVKEFLLLPSHYQKVIIQKCWYTNAAIIDYFVVNPTDENFKKLLLLRNALADISSAAALEKAIPILFSLPYSVLKRLIKQHKFFLRALCYNLIWKIDTNLLNDILKNYHKIIAATLFELFGIPFNDFKLLYNDDFNQFKNNIILCFFLSNTEFPPVLISLFTKLNNWNELYKFNRFMNKIEFLFTSPMIATHAEQLFSLIMKCPVFLAEFIKSAHSHLSIDEMLFAINRILTHFKSIPKFRPQYLLLACPNVEFEALPVFKNTSTSVEVLLKIIKHFNEVNFNKTNAELLLEAIKIYSYPIFEKLFINANKS